MPLSPDELRPLVEDYLDGLELWPALHGQAESVRYSITVGGKRVRPVICLATAEAAGARAEEALPAGCALELVHTFSLVHDDLPALDDDEERRGQPSTWKRFGEATGILAGDALLAEAFRLATSYDTPHVARELSQATLGMIGGQYLDVTGTAPDGATLHKLKTGCLFEAFRLATSYDTPHVARELSQATLGMIGGQYLDVTGTAPDGATLHKLKTGCLFEASVGLALWVAEVPAPAQAPWRAFADELGLLFQIVDDILDGDGYVVTHGVDGARRLADEAADRSRERLGEINAETSVLREIVDGLAVRTA